MALLPPREAMARTTANTAVTSATRRPNWSSPRSWSSSGFGSSTSGIGLGPRSAVAGPVGHLILHGGLAGLEGGDDALGLLLEVLTTLLEQVTRAALHGLGLLLRS